MSEETIHSWLNRLLANRKLLKGALVIPVRFQGIMNYSYRDSPLQP